VESIVILNLETYRYSVKENAMSNVDIIRAWKDPEYRRSLSKAELANVPTNPAGTIELKDTELDIVAGGKRPCTCKCKCTCNCVSK